MSASATTEQAAVATEPAKNVVAGRKKPLRQNHCFAPGCKSGQNLRRPRRPSDPPRMSLFSVPRNEQMFLRWQRYMPPRKDGKKLMRNSAVCERHFDPQFIVRYYEHIINKEVVRIERGFPGLTPDAVPTIFPESPKYYTRRVPKRRRPPQRAPLPPPKPKRARTPSPDPSPAADDVSSVASGCPEPVTTEQEPAPADPGATRASAEPEEQIVEREVTPAFPYEDMPLPSRRWARHVVSEKPLVIAYSTCRLSDDEPGRLVTEKLVLVREYAEHAECHVYFEGRRLYCFDGPGGTDYPCTLLQRVDQVKPCPGLGDAEEFPFTARLPYIEERGPRLHSAQCTSVGTARGAMCDKCVNGRKLLRKRLARQERKRLALAVGEAAPPRPSPVDSGEVVVIEDVSEQMCIAEDFRAAVIDDVASTVEVGSEVSMSVESGSGNSGPSSVEQLEVNGTAVPNCEGMDLR